VLSPVWLRRSDTRRGCRRHPRDIEAFYRRRRRHTTLGGNAPAIFEALAERQAKCAGYYQSLRFRQTKYGKPLAVDSHRNILAKARTFLKWSMGKGYLRDNPLEGVQGFGKRRHGKPQLRIDEARKWQAKAVQFGDERKRRRWPRW
jgi:hypothetical protein